MTAIFDHSGTTVFTGWSSRSGFRICLVLALALALRLALATPADIGSDLSVAYYPPALDLAEFGKRSWDSWGEWYVRPGVIVPLALAWTITGDVEAASQLAGLPFGVLQVLLTFLIGRLLFGDSVACVAALLEAVYPLSVLYGAQPLPDTPMAFWVTASIYCLLIASRHARSSMYMAAGFCLGLAYTAKITALFAAPVLLGVSFLELRRLDFRGLSLVAVGGLATIGLETLLLSVLNGELTMRLLNLLLASEHFSEGVVHTVAWSRYVPGFFAGMLWPLNYGFVYHGVMGWAAVVSAGYLTGRCAAPASVRIVILWWLGLILLINFACLGFERPVVYNIQMRYLMFANSPAVLVVAVALMKLSGRLRAALLVAVTASGLFCSAALFATARPHDGYRHLYGVVRIQDDAPAVYFQHPAFARYTRLAVDDHGDYRAAASGMDLSAAASGALAVLIIDNYHPVETLPPGYLEELRGPDWQVLNIWKAEPGLMAGLLELLHIETDKGFDKEVTVYRKVKRAAGGVSP